MNFVCSVIKDINGQCGGRPCSILEDSLRFTLKVASGGSASSLEHLGLESFLCKRTEKGRIMNANACIIMVKFHDVVT